MVILAKHQSTISSVSNPDSLSSLEERESGFETERESGVETERESGIKTERESGFETEQTYVQTFVY